MTIDRIFLPTLEEVEESISQFRPKIFTGTVDEQKATLKWGIDYLTNLLHEERFRIVLQDTPKLEWNPSKGLNLQSVSFREFASILERKSPYAYLQEDMTNVPFLWTDYTLPDFMKSKKMARHKLWISGKGLVTPLHYDPAETFHWVVQGIKEFVCYPPGLKNYYPHPFMSTAPFISRVDAGMVDLVRFPDFAKARPVRFTLRAGEILYLPAFWWHEVTSGSDLNISLNFVWFASLWRNLRYAPQMARSLRHVWRQLRGAARKPA